MLPVVAGSDETRRQILIYAILLAPIAMLPAFTGLGGIAYLAAASVLNVGFLWLAVQVYRLRQGPAAEAAARRLFFFSILYLFALFAVLLVEHVAAALLN